MGAGEECGDVVEEWRCRAVSLCRRVDVWMCRWDGRRGEVKVKLGLVVR